MDNESIFYDVLVTVPGCNTVSMRVTEAELDDVVHSLSASGEQFTIQKVTVIDSILHRQTPLRPSRFGYLHHSPPSRPAESGASPAQTSSVIVSPAKATNPKIADARPDTVQQKIFSSDFQIAFQKDRNWRPMTGTGHIHAIADRINGTALATDGVLIAIRRSDGEIIIGHLDNWINDTAANGGNGKRRTSKTALLDALFA